MIQDFRSDLLSGRSGRGPEMPVLGYLRSGIMRPVRPKKDATQAEHKAYEERVVKYSKLVEEGLSWDDIGKQIGGKQYLTPENQDYFTVREIDCKTNPENAKTLHELYADKDGKIRRVPIVLLSNDWIEVIPHSLAYWTQTKWVYRSEYVQVMDKETGERGWERICLKPVPYEKGKRPFGGQDTTMRCVCIPETCEEYQKELCKLSGYIEGVIPGTKGVGVWRIHTKSIYSFRQMMGMLHSIEKGSGRINGLIDPQTKKAVLRVRKLGDQEVSRYDFRTGETKKVDQDLIHLEADIDMFELMLAYQPQQVLKRGEQARALLSGADVHTERAPKNYTIKEHTPEPGEIATAGNGDGKDDFVPEVENIGEEARRSCLERCVAMFMKMPTEVKKLYKKEFPKEITALTLEEVMKAEAWLNDATATLPNTGSADAPR